MTDKAKLRGRPSIYPWDSWLSKEKITLVKGEHYKCTQHSMCVLIRITGAKRQLKLGVYPKKDGRIEIVNKSFQ